MNAKHDDLSRIQEVFDIACRTKRQIEILDFRRERFLEPATDEDDLISEGIMNRVFRITEELGHLSEAVSSQYGFERQAASGVRNRLAHAYGEVDRDIIWSVIEDELDDVITACRRYCDDMGVDLD